MTREDRKEKREENVAKGKDLIERELKRLGLEPYVWMTDEKMQEAATKFTFNDIEDMLAAIGFQGITAAQIVTKLTEKLRREQEAARKREEEVNRKKAEAERLKEEERKHMQEQEQKKRREQIVDEIKGIISEINEMEI